MRPPKLHKWADVSELGGLLIFAQSLNELLFDHTVDSYKATALNLYSNVLELRFLTRQVVDGTVRPRALNAIVEELDNKVKNDPVVKQHSRLALDAYLGRLHQAESKASEMLPILTALRAELKKFYWPMLIKQIEQAVHDSRRKRDIRALANAFVVEAETQGFDRSYIYYTTRQFFFNTYSYPSTINSADQIHDFLSIFKEAEEQEFNVTIRGSRSFSEMRSFAEKFRVTILATRPEGLPTRFKVNSFLGDSHDYPLYLVIDGITAKDPVTAREIADSTIELMSSTYCLHVHEAEPRWNKTCLVLNKQTGDAPLLNPRVSPMAVGSKGLGSTRRSSQESAVERTVEILQGSHFTPDSRRSFIKAIDYHRAAIEALTPENRLLNLWAALEGFSPPPDRETERISHYIATLLPSLCLTYPEKLFRYVASSLEATGPRIAGLINDCEIDGTFVDKVSGLLTTSDLMDKRKELYAALEQHPLLRFRCFTLHEQFSAKKHIRKTIADHRQRVAWHIQRIYTTRNQIIHRAESLPYITTLVENLHTYLDTLISSIVTVGIEADTRIAIPTALAILEVQEEIFRQSLEGEDEECTISNFQSLIFGSHNPLSPIYSS